MPNKIFEIQFIDNTSAIIEGTDLFKAFDNHFGEYSQLMQEFYLSHKEITNNYESFKATV